MISILLRCMHVQIQRRTLSESRTNADRLGTKNEKGSRRLYRPEQTEKAKNIKTNLYFMLAVKATDEDTVTAHSNRGLRS